MITIDVLETPVIKPTPFGDVTLTHRAWGFTIQAWNNPPMRSYSVLGVVDETGVFHVYPDTEEYAAFSLPDFLALSSDPEVGPHVTATVAAVKAAHISIVGQLPLAVPQQVARPAVSAASKGEEHVDHSKRRARAGTRGAERRQR